MNRRLAISMALAGVAGLAGALVGPALAQTSTSGLSTLPPLRGALDGDPGAPLSNDATGVPATGYPANPAGGFRSNPDVPGSPASALPADGGVGTTVDGPQAPERPRGRFAFPKGTAKTEDRIRYPRRGTPTLPDFQNYPTSTPAAQRPRGAGLDAAGALRGSGAAIDTIGGTIRPGPTVATLPFTARLRTRIDDAPYDPVGFDVGSLRLTPYVTQSIGYDSNPNQTQLALRPSAFERTEGGLSVASAWARNSFTASVHGGYDVFFSAPEANRPDAVGVADYRYDVDRDTALDAEARFAIDTLRIGSPEVSNNAQSRPLISTYGASFGGSEGFGRINLALHGSLDRTTYGDAEGAAGVAGDLSSIDYSDPGLRLRATYELTPVLRPYIDLFADDRLHDHTVDSLGFQRDSVGAIAQVGTTFELTRLLTGEMSAGYGGRTYEDPRLKDIRSPVFNGVLTYAATPLTTVSLRAATSFDETNIAGASGIESRSATLEVSHLLLRNMTITGALAYLNTTYVGVPIVENTLVETLKAEYHLSRSLVATATLSHERLDSTLAGASFGQDVALVGLRWQR